jgi:DNA-binding NarL/FixJ family response regulator
MNKARILLADDHVEFSNVVEGLLKTDFDVVGKVRDGEALVTAALRLHPDIIVSDISMPILNGIEATKKLRLSGVQAKIIFLTVHSDGDFVRACLDAGACGYVLKFRLNADLLAAMDTVLEGRTFLSDPDDLTN